MDDERHVPGMPVLHRQPVREPMLPPSLQGLPQRSVPEARPTPLQAHYINLSVIALICGAWRSPRSRLGAGMASPLVKLCVLIGAPILIVTDGRRRAADLAQGLGVDADQPRPRGCSASPGWSLRRSLIALAAAAIASP